MPVLQPDDFGNAAEDGIIIDTRLPEAFAGGHIPRSYSIWLNGLAMFGSWVAGRETKVYLVVECPSALEQLPHEFGKSSRIAVTCSVGHRASLATSVLKRHSYEDVRNLLGGMTAWQQLDLPTVRETEQQAA